MIEKNISIQIVGLRDKLINNSDAKNSTGGIFIAKISFNFQAGATVDFHRKGLYFFSYPTVVSGPCPLNSLVSSGNVLIS